MKTSQVQYCNINSRIWRDDREVGMHRGLAVMYPRESLFVNYKMERAPERLLSAYCLALGRCEVNSYFLRIGTVDVREKSSSNIEIFLRQKKKQKNVNNLWKYEKFNILLRSLHARYFWFYWAVKSTNWNGMRMNKTNNFLWTLVDFSI